MKCESFPTRNLGCVDWFRRGQSSIYDIDDCGRAIVRGYGADTSWVPLPTYQSSTRRFAFLPQTITYIRQDDTLTCIAHILGQELRNCEYNLKFNGRNTNTSKSVLHFSNSFATEVKLMPHQHSCANFYCGTHADLTKLKNMNVLGSGVYPKDLLQECNNLRLHVGGRAVFDHLHGVLRSPLSSEMLGACYHKGADQSAKQITYYQGHLDKAFVRSGWLIPLGERFFTFVSFPTAWHYQQDELSLASYNRWVVKLKEKEKKELVVFAKAFEVDAKKAMKIVDCKIYIFENKIGSVLAFPTNICYHATVTPPSDDPRDLLIIHPLIGDRLL
jgi:hypothetical protein